MPLYKVSVETYLYVIADTPEAAEDFAQYDYDAQHDNWDAADFHAREVKAGWTCYNDDAALLAYNINEDRTVGAIVAELNEAKAHADYLASLPQLPFEGGVDA